jgi:hypothetical protein
MLLFVLNKRMHVRFITSPTVGLTKDAVAIEQALRQIRMRFKDANAWTYETVDSHTWGSSSQLVEVDIQIFLELPVRLAMPWGRYNVMVVNQEWWRNEAWDWAFTEMDLFVFKSEPAAALFPEIPAKRRIVMPWRSDVANDDGDWNAKEARFLYMLGRSLSKERAARDIVAGWRSEWPPLELWCTPEFAAAVRPTAGPNVEFQTEFRPVAEKEARQRACKWHVVASAAKGFGYVMEEAIAAGVPVVWSGLPVFDWTWGSVLGDRGRIAVVRDTSDNDTFRDERLVSTGLDKAVESVLTMTGADVIALRTAYKTRRKEILAAFRDGWERVVANFRRDALDRGAKLPVAPVKGAMPPKVAVITLTRNRRAWWANMFNNITTQKWPISRLEWIIVDDSEPEQRLDDKVVELNEKVPALTVRYVALPFGEHPSIGAKRNMGVAASPDADLFVMMDDDDHYPPDSVAVRASWLTCAGKSIAYCANIAMYDVTRYISAINVSPLTDPATKRSGEATMAFTRAAWLSRPFPDVSMAEGEEFLRGRLEKTVEMPPGGIIVSFIHTANTSSRRVPADQEPNGCHYGFSDAFFRWLHKIGGGCEQ